MPVLPINHSRLTSLLTAHHQAITTSPHRYSVSMPIIACLNKPHHPPARGLPPWSGGIHRAAGKLTSDGSQPKSKSSHKTYVKLQCFEPSDESALIALSQDGAWAIVVFSIGYVELWDIRNDQILCFHLWSYSEQIVYAYFDESAQKLKIQLQKNLDEQQILMWDHRSLPPWPENFFDDPKKRKPHQQD